MAEEHKGGQNRRCLVEDVPAAADCDDHRVGPAGGDGNRDQDHHVQGPRFEGAHGSVEEDPARVADHGEAKDQLEDVIAHSEWSRNAKMQDLASNRRPQQDRHRKDRGDEKAIAHVLDHRLHRHVGVTAVAHHLTR